jgi:hypothetical protein
MDENDFDALGFESDDDDEEENEGEVVDVKIESNETFPHALLVQVMNRLFIHLMKVKPFSKATQLLSFKVPNDNESIGNEPELRLYRHIGFVFSDFDVKAIFEKELLPRLVAAKFQGITMSLFSDFETTRKYDLLVHVSSETLVEVVRERVTNLSTFLNSSGLLFHITPEGLSEEDIFPSAFWAQESKILEPILIPKLAQSLVLTTIHKRSVLCNETAVIYWTNNTKRLQNERSWIEKISVPITTEERETGIFSEENHKKAVNIINQYGVCIFPGLYSKEYVKGWADIAIEDMHLLLKVLKEKKDIDLFLRDEEEKLKKLEEQGMKPKPKQMINNFYELSMREALRCDIRNTPKMKQKVEQHCREDLVFPLFHNHSRRINLNPNAEKIAKEEEIKKPYHEDIRFHQGLLPVLHDVLHPPSMDPFDAKGNWGRWNFEGLGPDVKLPFRVGRPGVIFSFPGCCDQTIHADAPQLFVHTDLPAHYFNYFICTKDNGRELQRKEIIEEFNSKTHKIEKKILNGYSVGQTAFVVGSHLLKRTADIMVGSNGQEVLEEFLIRPQLEAGDALVFDCRILHFGLANQPLSPDQKINEEDNYGEESWRPLLYVNYHQDWFHDPKNWNDNEKLL